jgi:hypothetical protein
MTAATYKRHLKERRMVEKRIGKPPRHVSASEVDPANPPSVQCVNAGYSVFNPFQVKESMMSTKDAQSAKSSAVDRMLAKAEQAAAREQARKEKSDARIAKTAEKEHARAAKAAAKAAQREQKAAEREARDAERKAQGLSTGPMAALRDAKKQYVKSATGQYRTTDELAEALDAVPSDRIVELCKEVLGLTSNPYILLNRGQQSMNMRNKLRFAIKKGTVTIAEVIGTRDRGQYTLTHEQLEEREAARKAAVSRRFS